MPRDARASRFGSGRGCGSVKLLSFSGVPPQSERQSGDAGNRLVEGETGWGRETRVSLVAWSTRLSILCSRGRSHCGEEGEIELALVETPPVSAARWHREEFRDPGTRAVLHAVMENRWAASSWRLGSECLGEEGG